MSFSSAPILENGLEKVRLSSGS